MEKGSVAPKEACVPEEGARQPALNKAVLKNNTKTNKEAHFKKITAYNDLLSQPPRGMSHRQKLVWLQQRRSEGLWAQCDDCNSWRYLPHVLDNHELPNKWYCSMNPDASLANCSAAEIPIHLHDEEDLIHSEFAAGSLVVARMPGWPWWPAMVDDCPDTEQYYWLDGFSDIPTHYNVVFFDATDVTRAWITPSNIRPYGDSQKLIQKSLKIQCYRKRIEKAKAQADDAEKLPLVARLVKYSFIARYKGKIYSPRKLNKTDLKKHQEQFKRKFKIDLPNELSDSDDDIVMTPEAKKKVVESKKPSKKSKMNADKIIENSDSNLTMISSNENNPVRELSLAVQVDCNSDTINDSMVNGLRETDTNVYNDAQLLSTPPSDNFDY